LLASVANDEDRWPHLAMRSAQFLDAAAQRRLLRLPRRTLARLAHSAQPWVLAVSSGEALQHVWQQLPPTWQQRLRAEVRVVVASDRLGEQARSLGLRHISRSAGPTAAQ
ncbi:hypothetical protein, partial [Mesorhizobium sp. M8A.F.Ca.ET.142.01.1.1]|uniref:hypothetical protein n=1 Tax=Mesorhizobium sp. M8A.F.Ca.ET.142.01.1.1 TaxID=2563958 RepID=UPI001AED79D0